MPKKVRKMPAERSPPQKKGKKGQPRPKGKSHPREKGKKRRPAIIIQPIPSRRRTPLASHNPARSWICR